MDKDLLLTVALLMSDKDRHRVKHSPKTFVLLDYTSNEIKVTMTNTEKRIYKRDNMHLIETWKLIYIIKQNRL